MNHAQIAFFSLATVGNILLSRRMLKDPRCHGFYRFFVFQCIIVLITLNAPYWIQPRGVLDFLSTYLLYIALFYALAGYYQLWTSGRPRLGLKTKTFLGFENTTILVTTGLYRFIRHPMYGALLFLAVGLYLRGILNASPGRVVITSLAVGCCLGFVLLAAWAEERENLDRFGEAFERYRRTTKMFIPLVL
jgi:protein-S-isoprenylcysteine O-methyltransferase Ste14